MGGGIYCSPVLETCSPVSSMHTCQFTGLWFLFCTSAHPACPARLLHSKKPEQRAGLVCVSETRGPGRTHLNTDWTHVSRFRPRGINWPSQGSPSLTNTSLTRTGRFKRFWMARVHSEHPRSQKVLGGRRREGLPRRRSEGFLCN